MAQHRRFARLWTPRAELEVTLEQLKIGDLVVVSTGEAVPADGRVVWGDARIDERPILGGDGSTLKREGDRVFAGTRLGSGELRVEVEAIGSSTRLAGLARSIHSGMGHNHSTFAVTAEGEAFARRAVVPTLAAAGLGLLTLDLAAAAAVLRPDYATGTGLGVSLELLRDAALCARQGIIIRDASAFRRLAEVALLLFADHPDLEIPRAGRRGGRLRRPVDPPDRRGRPPGARRRAGPGPPVGSRKPGTRANRGQRGIGRPGDHDP